MACDAFVVLRFGSLANQTMCMIAVTLSIFTASVSNAALVGCSVIFVPVIVCCRRNESGAPATPIRLIVNTLQCLAKERKEKKKKKKKKMQERKCRKETHDGVLEMKVPILERPLDLVPGCTIHLAVGAYSAPDTFGD